MINRVLRFVSKYGPVDTDPDIIIGKIKKGIKKEHQDIALREASYVHDSVISWGGPKVWEIETTSYCGGKCVMCPKSYSFSRELMHMPLDLFKSIIEQLPKESQVNLGGGPVVQLFHYGSPTLYPYFFESIDICKKKGYYVIVSEIASLFTAERVREAVEAGLDELWMIVDGMDDETFKKIRGNAVSFSKSVENITRIVELKKKLNSNVPSIQVVMIRQPYNAHQWDEFKDFWGNFDGVNVNLAYMSNFGGDIPQINNLLKQLQAQDGQPEEDRRVQNVSKYRCFYPWHSVSILADGRVVPCCRDMNGTYVLGDLRQKSLVEIWNDKPIQALREEWISGKITNELCKTCNEANVEIRLPNSVYKGFDRITRKNPDKFVVKR